MRRGAEFGGGGGGGEGELVCFVFFLVVVFVFVFWGVFLIGWMGGWMDE